MSIEIRQSHDRQAGVEGPPTQSGPVARVIAAGLVTGLVTALVLTLVVFPGADESTITGSILLAFGLGWAMMGVLLQRFGERLRWTAVPAVAMGVSGLSLLVFHPANAAMATMGWIWPLPMLALAAYIGVQARHNLPVRGRRMLAPVVAVLALGSVAAMYENVTVAHDQNAYAAPGAMYDVGDHRLHLDCHGDGNPTVVLSNGLGEITASWARIVAQVETTTRVCAYDRAGQGWSDDSDDAQDGTAAAEDLHTLLKVAGERGPYLLVGHSIGGTYAMSYAAKYPEQVAGLVLLDSSSPEQFTTVSSFSGQYAVMRRVVAVAPTLSRFGIGRVISAAAPSHLPAAAADQVSALTASARGATNVSAEWSVLPDVFEQARNLTTLGGRPLAVLTASESLHKMRGWDAAQDQLASLSTNSLHQVADSTHLGLLENETGSTEAVRTIGDVVTAVRGGTALEAE